MSNTVVEKKHAEINNLVNNHRIAEAIARLREEPVSLTPVLRNLLSRQEETYRYLLQYFAQGVPDEGRLKMIAEIASNLHFINDSILRESIVFDSSDLYSSTLRLERVRKANLAKRLEDCSSSGSMALLAAEAGGNQEIRTEADTMLADLFGYVMTMFGSPREDYILIQETATSPSAPFSLKAQIVSALLLGNLLYFDRYAYSALLEIFAAEEDAKISARALVALVMIAAAHPERVASDPLIAARLDLWNDSLVIYRQLRETISAIIRSRDTDRISTKMRNEVLPELMKLRPEILDKLRNASENSDMEMLDVNPEWEDLLGKSGLGDKLKELTDMQMDGGDVMMMAFSNLKQFPFFRDVPNWFLPFSTEQHEVALNMNESSEMFNQLLDVDGVMCDSDKYSFVFSLSRMPEEQRKAMASRLSEQMSQLKEAMADKKLKSSVPEFDSELTRYVRDIYRFAKLFRRKEDFPDPFAKPLDFLSLPVMGDILSDPEMLSLVGEFYFKHGYYAEALPLFKKLDQTGESENLAWEKIGYCYNALGRIPEALEWYRKAELINPDSQWLTKRMAQCFHILRDYSNSSEYYAKALESDPENEHLLVSAAGVALDAGDYKKALSLFHHAEYLKPDSMQLLRALAWCHMLDADLDKADSYIAKILLKETHTASDKMNAGHISLVQGRIPDALALYRDAASDRNFSMEGLEKGFREDSKELLRLGVTEEDLNLILEKLRLDTL